MAFGIGGGLFFGYLPFIRINGMPLVTYRAAAGHILRQIAAIPGVTMYRKKFRNRDEAMAELDRALASSIPVGLQTGVFWLPYFPKALRFHFNAHNLVVYGKEGNEYLISDPVFPKPVRCPADDLARARFASGALAPKGKMYYFKELPARLEHGPLIRRGIQSVRRMMLGSPIPLIGVRGIRFLAKRLITWPQRLGRERADLHLGHVVRMQEEIGTGGGGFRFIYAAFLQEAAERLARPVLNELSETLIDIGDEWREFALSTARMIRDREPLNPTKLADQLRAIADREQTFFRDLRRAA